MRLIVGLGNPGSRYAKTRHNVGFMALDRWCHDWQVKSNWQAQLGRQAEVLYMKPQTFMNLSGRAVQAVAHYYKITPADIIVLYDDKDMTFGKVRFRQNGSSGGHNGMKSIIECLGTEQIARIKIGVAPPAEANQPIVDTADYVLGRFSTSELTALTEIITIAKARLDNWLKK